MKMLWKRMIFHRVNITYHHRTATASSRCRGFFSEMQRIIICLEKKKSRQMKGISTERKTDKMHVYVCIYFSLCTLVGYCFLLIL